MVGKASVSQQQRPRAAPADPVAEVVTEDRGDGPDGDDRGQRELARAREKPRSYQGGLTGPAEPRRTRQDETEECAVAEVGGDRDEHGPSVPWPDERAIRAPPGRGRGLPPEDPNALPIT